MSDYLALTKPRITVLILMSAGIGFFFGAGEGWRWATLLHMLLGTALIASGTAALNQWYEREADGRMHRTQLRPLPAGRIAPQSALLFGIALSVAGSIELWFGANPLTCWLGIFTEVMYLGLYTPLKQKTWHATTIGAVPGAMPPLLGYAAAAGLLNAEALSLFALLFVWQFPHFYAIAWMYREEYGRAGIRMLPVVEPDGLSTARQILLFSLLLVPVSLLPAWLSMSGPWYLTGAALLGAWFLYHSVRVARERTVVRARAVLKASVLYLPALYCLMLLDRRG